MGNFSKSAGQFSLSEISSVLVLTILGAFVRWYGIASPSLWGDELLTRVGAMKNSTWDLLTWHFSGIHGNHAPCGFLVSRWFWLVTGSDDPLGWRFPYLACGIACVPLAWWCCRRHVPALLSLLFAALVAVDPNQTDVSQWARVYPLLLMLSLLGFGLGVRWLDAAPTSGRGLVMLLILVLNCWTHFLGIVVIVALGVTVMMNWRKEKDTRGVLLWLLVLGIALVLGNIGIGKNLLFGLGEGLPEPSIKSFQEKISFLKWTLGTLPWIPLPFVNSFVYLVAFAGWVWLVVGKRFQVVAISFLVAGFLTLWLQIYILGKHDFISQKYLALFQPAWWLGLAAVAVLPRQHWLRLAGSLFLVLYLAFQTWHCLNLDRTYETIFHSRQDGRTVREVAEFFEAHGVSGKGSVTFPGGKGYQSLALEYVGVSVSEGGASSDPEGWRLYHVDTLSDEKVDVGLGLEKRRELVKRGARWYAIRERDGVEEIREFR